MEFLREWEKRQRFGSKAFAMRFADGGGSGDGTGTGDGAIGGQPDGGDVKTFDDILKDKAYQSEFDKRITKAIETAKVKWDADAQQKISEAARMAKMNADEKEKYKKEQDEKDYQKRLADVTARELKAEAKEILAEKGLPGELAEILNFADADTCKKGIEAVETAFKTAVEKGIEERIKKSAGGIKSGSTGAEMSGVEAAFYGINPNLRK